MNSISFIPELTLLNKLPESKLPELKELCTHVNETESMLAAFWHASPVLSCVAKDGIFIKVNPFWTKTLGWTEEELLSTPYKEFVHPDDLAPTTKIEKILSDDFRVYSFKNRYKHKFHDKYILIEWYASQDTHNGIIYATGIDRSNEQNQGPTRDVSFSK